MARPLRTLRARLLRNEAPKCERLLWQALRSRQIEGVQFRRQYSIDRYFADFACPAARLVIELDGESHVGREAYDADRTALIEALGWRVIRFDNQLIRDDIEGVLASIQEEIRLASPSS